VEDLDRNHYCPRWAALKQKVTLSLLDIWMRFFRTACYGCSLFLPWQLRSEASRVSIPAGLSFRPLPSHRLSFSPGMQICSFPFSSPRTPKPPRCGPDLSAALAVVLRELLLFSFLHWSRVRFLFWLWARAPSLEKKRETMHCPFGNIEAVFVATLAFSFHSEGLDA